jgi:hypothetical protein
MEEKEINPTDQDLERLESEMRRLKIEYDIFFNGGALKPPIDTKGRVETMIKRLFDVKGMNFGQRFKYNGLVARYNVMRELWRRQTQRREESGLPPTVEAVSAARALNIIIRCRDPKREPEKVSELYDHLLAAKRECGERVHNLSFEAFQGFILTRTAQMKRDLKADAVDFIIAVESGRVRFTARAANDDEPQRKIPTGALRRTGNLQ